MLINDLKNLNAPRIGAFGEYLFKYFSKEVLRVEIYGHHKNDTDFIVDGERVDVKTKVGINAKFNYQENKDILYAFVEISGNDARILFKGRDYKIQNDDLGMLWNRWIDGKEIEMSSKKSKDLSDEWSDIKLEIKENFESFGIDALKVIQRAKQFKGESPHNLIDYVMTSQPKVKCCRIYVEFNGHPKNKNNIKKIFAFPEVHIDDLPRLQNLRLKSGLVKKNVDKVDLDRMPEKYVFRDLEDLYLNYQRRFLE